MKDINPSLTRLEWLCNNIPSLLRGIPEHEFSNEPAPGKWSKKQILGHLIDSATNNHHRLVRAQFENDPAIGYDPDLWNRHNYHRDMPTDHLIVFWEHYNRHLAAIARSLPAQMLARSVNMKEKEHNTPVDLAFVITDYVKHLEHHLHQLVPYNKA